MNPQAFIASALEADVYTNSTTLGYAGPRPASMTHSRLGRVILTVHPKFLEYQLFALAECPSTRSGHHPEGPQTPSFLALFQHRREFGTDDGSRTHTP